MRRAAPSPSSCAWTSWRPGTAPGCGRRLLFSRCALVLDVLDGYVARLDRRRQSTLGADLDSLADVISFGVAPAVIGYTLGMRGGWDVVVLTYFVVCGVSRLARFNATAAALADEVTGKVKYFEGTPIPTSIAIVALLSVAVLPGAHGRSAVAGCDATRAGAAAPAGADLRAERQRDDQRHPASAEALSVGLDVTRGLTPSTSSAPPSPRRPSRPGRTDGRGGRPPRRYS